MRLHRTASLVVAATLSLSIAACGGADAVSDHVEQAPSSEGSVEKDTTVEENLEKIPAEDQGPAPEDAPVEDAVPAEGN